MKSAVLKIVLSSLAFISLLSFSLGARQDGLSPIVCTFLGNEKRSYYGPGPAPKKLSLIWKLWLGGGETGAGNKKMRGLGSGWTGQPLIVEEDGKPFLIHGGLDHHLRKIDAETGKIVWQYEFDDWIKGTGTIVESEGKLFILQGSRRGLNRYVRSQNACESLRAVDYETGKELWRFNVPQTSSYSRDVDSSALLLNGIIWQPAENGILYLFSASASEPRIIKQLKLFSEKDAARHGGNLVIESSPALCKDKVIVTTGAGHVLGISVNGFALNWDLYIGSDLDGSPVISDDGYVFVSVEKQYISGQGGVFKLDPSKAPKNAVIWYFPTGNAQFAEWRGGVVGSPSINDSYNPEGTKPALCAFSAIDGKLYIVSQHVVSKKTVKGPDGKSIYRAPLKVFSANIGSSISTPVFVGDEKNDYLVAASYNGVYLFIIGYVQVSKPDSLTLPTPSGQLMKARVSQADHFKKGVAFESTPVVYRGRVFIGGRDGYLYCLGSA